MERVKIKLLNDVIYAKIPFWNNTVNEYQDRLVMIDTGATKTAFSSNVLKEIGFYSEEKKGRARTAGGFVDTFEVVIPKIIIGNMELADITVSSHEGLNDMPFDGIIGMNVMKQFGDIHISLRYNLITFEK